MGGKKNPFHHLPQMPNDDPQSSNTKPRDDESQEGKQALLKMALDDKGCQDDFMQFVDGQVIFLTFVCQNVKKGHNIAQIDHGPPKHSSSMLPFADRINPQWGNTTLWLENL